MIFTSQPVSNSVINLGIKLLNQLPEQIKNLKTCTWFKREVKLLLEQNAFYSFNEYLYTVLF
jgi:hypothetical protein